MKQIALLGMPNTGKSTLFNRLTGAHAKVGNWPGITVELLTSKLLIGDQMVQLVDLPGIYDLNGDSEDEKVATTFLTQQPCDLLVVVLNASQLDRQSMLLTQLMPLNIPMLVVLNMADEAKSLGITIDVDGLAESLALPVCLLSAKRGQGMENLQSMLRHALRKQDKAASSETLIDVASAISQHVEIPAQASHQTTERMDKLLLHPWLGLPIFLGVMLLLFEAVFVFGKPLQDGMAWLFTNVRDVLLEPAMSSFSPVIHGLLLDGIYNGLGTVASFVPLIVLFFLFIGIVEDSGYLSRAAFLMDALMARLGLDGRSFVMLLMGFGCNVPALMGTRVIRSRGLRLLTMLVIPFSLCSARLQVFVFFTAALFSAKHAPLVLFSLYLISILVAMFTALLFKGHYVNNDPFVLEMPPYRFPTARQIVLRGWQEVRHFLSRVTRFIVLGVLLVWVLTNFPQGVTPGSNASWAGSIGNWLDPVLSPLGIDPNLTIALVFGFVAKEIMIGSLAVIYGLEGDSLVQAIVQQMNWIQAYSFMLFALIYTPCLSTIATIRNESRSISFTAVAVAWPLVVAWIVSFAFYQIAARLAH
ncbi:MAG: Ferrous iron transport protein [Pseudomonadota bacterium]|jgi:ferrous iron transport protein B